MVHGSPRNQLDEYVYPENPYLETLFEGVTQNVVVLGHTHVPFVSEVDGRFVLNPGSVGQPRDGNPKASYVIYDTEENKAVIHRVEYPIGEVVEMIEALDLPLELGQRLYFGV
jgi:predicted phosphodiesterase